jgi:putative ABC transport system permease protein
MSSSENGRIRAEVEHHLAELERLLREQGLSPDEARREARIRFGDPARIERTARSASQPTALRPLGHMPRRLIHGILRDSVHVIRGLRRAPAFTGAVGLTLALALGATMAVFGVVWAVLLRPLDLRDPGSLVMLVERAPEGRVTASPTSAGTFHDWRRELTTVRDIAAWEWVSRTLEDPERPEELVALQVSGNLLPMLGIRPVIGRILTPEDEVVGAPSQTVMLSYDLWVRRFGRDSGVLGHTIQVDGAPREIVGVMPDRLDFVEAGALLFDPSPHLPWNETNRGVRTLHVVARLAAGRTAAQASAEVAAVTEGIAERYPLSARGWSAEARPIAGHIVGDARPRILAVGAGVLLLLLVAAMNVANLLLVRSAERRREMALRAALGAGRSRLARMRLVEGVLLGLVGGAGGVPLAAALQHRLAAQAGSLPRPLETGLSLTTIAFGLGLALVVGLTIAAIPALRRFEATLASLGRGTAGANAGGSLRWRHTMLVLQLGGTTLLLVGAGLLIRTVGAVRQVDLGFNPEDVVAARISLDPRRYPGSEAQREYYDRLLERVRAIPGVTGAGLTSALPMDPVAANFDLPTRAAEATSWEDAPQADFRIVSPGLMEVLDFRLIQGRFLTDEDRGGRAVALVNQSAARVFWPGESPLGRRIQPVWLQDGFAEVVGVVQDTRFYGPMDDPRAEVFVPLSQVGWNLMTVAVRRAGQAEPLQAAVERAVVELDPLLPPMDVFPITRLVEATTARERFNAALLSGFAGLALALAATGVYGLLAYSVRQRTREMGVRIALGARPEQVTGMVLRTGVGLALVGVALGLGAAVPATRLIEGMLYGVRPLDPVTLAGVALLLPTVAAVACLAPALRAARLDPARTLKEE